ncbi:hypothetical protein [Dysgonomonas sp.]|jgi:hypothetical protein
MKQLVTRIILVIAAVAVFFTGAGVTFIIYCCSGCETEQMLVVTKPHTCCSQKTVAEGSHSCCASHTHHTQPSTQADTDGCATHFDAGHCQASRLSSDIDLSVFRPQVSSPFVWISDAYPVSLSNVLSEQLNDTDTYAQFESPPNIPPRDYLSLIRVLII